MKRLLCLTTLPLALAACSGADQPGPASPSGASGSSRGEQQKVVNLDYFDLGTLSPTPPAVTGRPGTEVLLGVELAARPILMECLVDPKNRGAEKKTHVVLDAALVDAGVEHKVTGQNLTPPGIACIEGALDAWTKAIPGLDAKHATGEVKSHIELDHVVGASPAVSLGVNDASDIAGAVRLALPGWGDCFASWKSAAPRLLKASLKAERAKDAAAPTVTLASVTFEPTQDPGAGKVAACLEGKLKVLKVKPPSGEALTVPYAFRLVHSGIEAPLPDASPELQLVQLDLRRGRRTAEVAVAIGERAQSLAIYDDAVKRFKAKAKPEVTIAELKDRCAALLAAGDKLVAAAEKQAATEQATHRFALEQKTRDPAWSDTETTSAKSLADAEKDLASYRGIRKTDENACPKVTY